MASIIIPIPFQYVRQQALPLDVDQTFATTAERTAYLSNPRRYPGMIVVDLQQELPYFLNSSRTAWVAFGSGGGGDALNAKILTSKAALRSEAPTAGKMYLIASLTEYGVWMYDAADTTSADNNSGIIVTTTGGFRYKRIDPFNEIALEG